MSFAPGRAIPDESSGSFKIGIVGAGWITSAYHLPVLQNLDEADVAFVADIKRSQAQKACRGYGAKPIEIGNDPTMLPPCDVIVLAIPVGVRSAYISEFADRGTAIFSEKPFAVNMDMHEEFLQMADIISCNYMRRHYNATQQLRRVVQSDTFGELERIEFVEEGKTGATGLSKDHFQMDPQKGGGGILLERGSHSLSQICEIFKDEKISVITADIIKYDGLDAEVDAVLEIDTGESVVEVNYHISRLRPIGSKMVFEFENGRLEADPYDPKSQVSLYPRTGEFRNESLKFAPDDTAATTTHQAMYLQWRTFLSQLSDSHIDSEIETMPLVTELITKIYDDGA